MPTTTAWGKGKTLLLLGPEGGSLVGFAAPLTGAGFSLITGLQQDPWQVLDDQHVSVVYVDGATAVALDLLREARARQVDVQVVVVRSRPTATEVSDAMQAGAADFLDAGSPGPTILARLHAMLHGPERAGAHTGVAAAVVVASAPGPAGLVGTSLPMRRLFHAIERVARFCAGVLLLGESGTGKELIARALHDSGPRRARPFVAVNCATLGKDLLENELFGHERGAFTGANAQKKGLFELADEGTLFLDEVGEMELGTQAKLLRVLERSEFRRVGGVSKIKVDVNVVAATNRDLHAAIAAGTFREDLYYRLKVVTLVVPPLRERREDIPALVEAFIAGFNRRHGARIRGIAPEAMRALIEQDWPGNVRELKNVVESAAMLSDEDVLQKSLLDETLGASLHSGSPPAARAGARVGAARVGAARVGAARVGAARVGAARVGAASGDVAVDELVIPLPALLADVERALIERTLAATGSRKAAAAALGIGLRTLLAKLRQYGLAVPEHDER